MPEPGAINWTLVVVAIVGAVPAVATVIATVYVARINAKAGRALANTEETKAAAAATAVSVEKVHVAVNSERTKMLAKIDTLQELVLTLTNARERAAGVLEGAAEQRRETAS